MSPVRLNAGSLFEHMRHICLRPRMFAPDFTLDHLALYITGYDDALGDLGQKGQHEQFREWMYKRHPKWRHLPTWWAQQVYEANERDLERTLQAIVRLLDEFLATEGAGFVRFPERETEYDIVIEKPEKRPKRSPRSKR
ncbi:MAG TPA: hypothetical protein VFZ09_18950 [Archangium sp.]|uniref:hypothetical protein n=1 Tax=Archangium sp. TaxID=1872627 RepID=UPI002E381EF4|nr:hypothetical protein [Archangium sp.]HEX5748326.1 hypothetical protein [Archangium sp.]